MIKLNLIEKTPEEKKIKDYMESNVSEELANKINNGVTIEKDGKTLINKKDLAGFMGYACKLAQEKAEKGARAACVDDRTVFGWAVHYFEEDTVIGKLYHSDGTEYTPPNPVTKPKNPNQQAVTEIKTFTAIQTIKAKPKSDAPSFFDMLEVNAEQSAEPETELDEENCDDEIDDCEEETAPVEQAKSVSIPISVPAQIPKAEPVAMPKPLTKPDPKAEPKTEISDSTLTKFQNMFGTKFIRGGL